MVQIIYRNYQDGDDKQLADLFIRAFQMNAGSQVRTEKSWNWRYVQSPGFEPEMCQIAEDIDNQKIVGAVMVNLVEKVLLNGHEYINGDVNDVSTDPDYTRRGIAMQLMENAIKYMEKKGYDISMLVANYNGFPRKKIYLKLGYKDVEREIIFFQFPNLFKFLKDVPILAFFFPFLFVNSYLPRIINRIRIKAISFFRDIKCEIVYNNKHFEYAKAANSIIPNHYTGFSPYHKKKVIWARIKVPSKFQRPTYIILRKGNKIIGGAALTHRNIYSFKFKIKIRFGVIHEIFLDHQAFNNQRNLFLGYLKLIDRIMKASTQRWIGTLLIHSHANNFWVNMALKGMRFFKTKGGAIMIKILKDNVRIPRFRKPLFVPSYVSLSIP